MNDSDETPSHQQLIPVAQTSFVDYNYDGRTYRVSAFDYRKRWCRNCNAFESWHSGLYLFVTTPTMEKHDDIICAQIVEAWKRSVEGKHPSEMTAIEQAERYRVLMAIKVIGE